MDLSGVFIPTVTPFDGAGEVDLQDFRLNAASWLRHPVRGFVVGGSTGEAVLLDESERTLLWEDAREVLGERLLIAGTGAESLRATLRMTRAAASAGADAVLVQPPSFYKGAMKADALEAHFRAVADASPVPVIVYQVPLHLNTLDIPNDVTARLSEHPNVVGIKDSRGKLELVEELVEICTPGFQVLVGNGALLFAALETGAAGGILGIANVLPGASAGIAVNWGAGDRIEAARLQEVVGPAHRGIVGGMGVPGVKRALDLLGLPGGAPRPPLRSLPASREDELRQLLREAGALH
ncbi:MAG: dihydrodipicolinate synthase family protein [Gemmatimonadales bacterium]|nr:MAG: dihydrodipicolinate synthase family protein [Gemmatimonadales bacterium]